MEEARRYPYGRARQDTVAQPFTLLSLAERFVDIMERMTGDDYVIVSRGSSWHLVLRITAEGKQVRA